MAPSKRWRWAMLLAKEKQPRPAVALDQEAPHSDGLFPSGLKSNVSSKTIFSKSVLGRWWFSSAERGRGVQLGRVANGTQLSQLVVLH